MESVPLVPKARTDSRSVKRGSVLVSILGAKNLSRSQVAIIIISFAAFTTILLLSMKYALSNDAVDGRNPLKGLSSFGPGVQLSRMAESGEGAKSNRVQQRLVSIQLHQVDKTVNVHYLEVEPLTDNAPVIVLLHGKAFTSEVWRKLGTLEAIREASMRGIAIDLPGTPTLLALQAVAMLVVCRCRSAPLFESGDGGLGLGAGFGATRENLETREQQEELLPLVWEALRIPSSAVLVSPSFSGHYSLPFVAQHPRQLAGFVPVAPVAVDLYRDQLRGSKVEALVVNGGEDHPEKADELASLFTVARVHVFPGAGHACYVQDPAKFADLLIDFAQKRATGL
eukprot:jgi/Mesen1/9024/ME000565S08344